MRVRLFAALREAAGVSEVQVEPGALGTILDRLRDRFGTKFSETLAYSSVLIDGERQTDPLSGVPDGTEVALLPPFSGGAVGSAHPGRTA